VDKSNISGILEWTSNVAMKSMTCRVWEPLRCSEKEMKRMAGSDRRIRKIIIVHETQPKNA
jgi:hypothetical protein